MVPPNRDVSRRVSRPTRRRFIRAAGVSTTLGPIGSLQADGFTLTAYEGDGDQPSTATNAPVDIVYDPYEGVDWDTVGHHKCEFHNHVRGSMTEPADVVDLYHDLGYTVYAVAEHGTDPMAWPWTDFSSIGGSFEDRNPEALDVVSFPACEFTVDEHVDSLFSTLTHADVDTGSIGDRWDQSHEIIDRTDHYVPEEGGGLAVLAHPVLYYYYGASEAWERYQPDFETRTREQGMLGLEVFNRGSILDQDLRLWDHLLTAFAPERMIWGFGVDDPREYALGSDVDVNWTTILLDESEFDPTDQSESRRATARAMTAGRTLLNRRQRWDPDRNDPATAPQVHAIDVDAEAGTITIDATDHDGIGWVSNGGIVSTGETVELTDDHVPYIRAHLTNERGADTCTQPFGLGSG